MPSSLGSRGSLGIEKRFFIQSDLRDLLDAVTIIHQHLIRNDYHLEAIEWQRSMEVIFREENVSYRVDKECGVHYFQDSSFEGTRLASISVLTSSRYSNALIQYEQAFIALDQLPQNTKQSIRSVFSAVECVFRLLFPSADRLGAAEITTYLAPKLDLIYSGDNISIRSSQKILRSFREWVDAAHFFRHEQGVEEPTQPPLQLTILIINQASGYLRWLAEIDVVSSTK